MRIRVLVVDHQTLVRHAVKLVAQSARDLEIVGEAAASGEAVRQAVDLSPDVVLIETQLPDGGALTAIRTIRQRCPEVRVLVLTSGGDAQAFGEAAAAGAIGFVLKDITPENLVKALRAAYNHRTTLSPTVAQQIVQRLALADANGLKMQEVTDREGSPLRPHDVEVLSRVGQGLSDKEIAAQLFLSESAVKTRLRHIYRRLGLKNRAQAAVFALEKGLLHIESEKT
jgi:DNA-binding NarL/FixJ family response regulator